MMLTGIQQAWAVQVLERRVRRLQLPMVCHRTKVAFVVRVCVCVLECQK